MADEATVAARIAIPIFPVPLTLQVLAVVLSTFIGVRSLPRSAAAKSTVFKQTRRKSRPVQFELSEFCRAC